MNLEKLTTNAISLLKHLIETPSFSKEEENTAKLIEGWFMEAEIPFQRTKNNIWATNKHFDESKPTLLLNSHHDTVKPNSAYTKDPFKALVEDGKLYGLGSNDAGGCLVSLIATFTHFYAQENLNYNLVIVASAEEENSGANGLNSMLPIIPQIDVAIVGEPTLMNLQHTQIITIQFIIPLKFYNGLKILSSKKHLHLWVL
jgi:acetylornithine deacetylase